MIRKTLQRLMLAATIAVAGCNGGPKIEKLQDLTGDNIPDVMIRDSEIPALSNKYLFIGQENGGFIRSIESSSASRVKYFKTDDGKVYFFDGQFYRESLKEAKAETKKE